MGKLKDLKDKMAEATWNRVVVALLRFSIGGLFIFSGFAKSIDPWGSVYKFADYFKVLGLDMLLPLVLVFAIVLGVVEFVLGVFLFLGTRRRITPALLLCMMSVMLPLTLYLAITDAVPDCGCFGDAWVISNWTTFWKNVAITLGLIHLYVFNYTVVNIYGYAVQWLLWLASFAYSLTLAFVGYNYQPLVDFRPYKLGTPLLNDEVTEKLNHDEAEDYVFIYEKDGVEKEFSSDSLPDEEDGWEYVDRRATSTRVMLPDTGNDRIVIADGGEELTADLLDHNKMQLIFLFPDMSDVDISSSYIINDLCEMAQDNGAVVFALTSGTEEEVQEWNDLSMASYPTYRIDDSELKMIARGNPAVVFVDKGKIQWKRTMRSITSEQIEASRGDLMKVSNDFDPQGWLKMLTVAYLIALIFILFVNRVHKVVIFCINYFKKSIKKT